MSLNDTFTILLMIAFCILIIALFSIAATNVSRNAKRDHNVLREEKIRLQGSTPDSINDLTTALWQKNEPLPDDLTNSHVFLSEQYINNKFFHGRVDQVFKLANGQLIVIGTKLRKYHGIYLSDKIQISVYAQILKDTYRESISDHGYICTTITSGSRKGEEKYHKVVLLTSQQLKEYAIKYRKIRSGQHVPQCTCNGKMTHT